MPMRDTTTWKMAFCAAATDSPRRFPFSSVMGMPSFSSLRGQRGRGGHQGAQLGGRLVSLRVPHPRAVRYIGGSQWDSPGVPVPPPRAGTHLCLISGMLMQLAAATAAKGT